VGGIGAPQLVGSPIGQHPSFDRAIFTHIVANGQQPPAQHAPVQHPVWGGGQETPLTTPNSEQPPLGNGVTKSAETIGRA